MRSERFVWICIIEGLFMWDKFFVFIFFRRCFGMVLFIFKREYIKKNLRNDEYDLVIIGGGIIGVGIVLDVSERGMKVVLVEM